MSQAHVKWITREKIADFKSPTNVVAALFGDPTKLQNVIIGMHGFGDNAENFSSLATSFKLDNTLWLFPKALKEVPMSFGGGQWFPLFGGNHKIDMQAAQTNIFDVKFAVMEQLNIPAKNMFVLGFSQGASMALRCGLLFPETLGGIISLSGFMLGYPEINKALASGQKKLPPVFLAHGLEDQVVFPIFYNETRDLLEHMGITRVTAKTYKIAHTISDAELMDIKNFIMDKKH